MKPPCLISIIPQKLQQKQASDGSDGKHGKTGYLGRDMVITNWKFYGTPRLSAASTNIT